MREARIIVADVMTGLAQLPSGSVHCVVTSPPYWGLRSYLPDGHPLKRYEIGSEPTLAEYLAKLVMVFREVRRVLRNDGTLWLNVGDAYASGSDGWREGSGKVEGRGANRNGCKIPETLKPKDLIGMPWRLAFALQADGWWLRADNIWHKINPMPESVTDRPTKSHEYVFLLARSARYYYDTEAVREAAEYGASQEVGAKIWNRCGVDTEPGHVAGAVTIPGDGGSRNLRSVWTIPTHPYPEAHFATYPPRLVEPCVKAGTSERGCCLKCGRPWRRILRRFRKATRPAETGKVIDARADGDGGALHVGNRDPERHVTETVTVGWGPVCACGVDAAPCTVLDPFSGAGTTGLVALRLGRNYVGIELNPEYAAMSRKRLAGDATLLNSVEVVGYAHEN